MSEDNQRRTAVEEIIRASFDAGYQIAQNGVLPKPALEFKWVDDKPIITFTYRIGGDS